MAKKDNKKIKDKVREALEIPKEFLKNYSRITIIGAEDVWIENYESILEYDDNVIRLSNNISIFGKNLVVEEINKDDVLIIGKINNIEFE